MKKILTLIIIVALAVCFLNRQPELCIVEINNRNYEIFIKNNWLYKNGIIPKKLSDEIILDYKIYDIDSDNNDELLMITKSSPMDEYGKNLVIYEFDEHENSLKLMELYRQDFSDVKPWKIDACNLDNDDETDIFIGVYKDTIFYKDFRKRPFFYSWDGKNLNKKWLGSFFTDWELVDLSFCDYYNTGYDVAIVLEKNKNDNYRIGIYNFIGFGFEHMKTINIDGDVKNISIEEILMKN